MSSLSKFDWYLERIGNVTAVFTGDTNADGIRLMYNISTRASTVQVLDINCQNQVGSQVVAVSKTSEVTSPITSQLNVTLDLNETAVMSSSIWKNGTTAAEGSIELCVRVDLVMDDGSQTSVNFDKQKLYVSVGLTQGFSITGIDLNQDVVNTGNTTAVVDYGITSCQCDDTLTCANSVLVQGDIAYVCVFAPTNRSILIGNVESLNLAAGSVNVTAVNNAIADDLTDVSIHSGGKIAKIRSQLRTEFFDSDNPANLTAAGIVSVRFGGSASRSLRFGMSNGGNQNALSSTRKMQAQSSDDVAGFSARMALAPINSSTKQPTADDKTGVLIGSVVGGIIAIAIVIALLVARRRKKKAHDTEIAVDCA